MSHEVPFHTIVHTEYNSQFQILVVLFSRMGSAMRRYCCGAISCMRRVTCSLHVVEDTPVLLSLHERLMSRSDLSIDRSFFS